MVFGAKPKKILSLKKSDKRKLSLLNNDFKLITGIESWIFQNIMTHTLCPSQLAAGNARCIYHGINRVIDAIEASRVNRTGQEFQTMIMRGLLISW